MLLQREMLLSSSNNRLQAEEAPEEDAGPVMVKVTLTAFADDKKVKDGVDILKLN